MKLTHWLVVLALASIIGLAGCGGDKSPDVPPEQMNQKGAVKGEGFQKMMQNTKAKNPNGP